MITLARFERPEEAHLVRMRLEAGGIPAFIHQDNTIQVQWMYSSELGGVRLQIDEEDFERAKEILDAPPVDSETFEA